MSPLSLCFVVAASIGSNGEGKSLAVPTAGEALPGGPGTPAVFAWGDIDGDGKLELAAVSADGALQLLSGTGGDRFEDVSERVGLAGVREASLAFWVDYDADGRLDLFVGARAGASRLFRNEGGTFIDMTAAAGLATEGAVRSVDWLDHDGDGRSDLHVVTAERHEIYRSLEGGYFERVALPLAGAGSNGPDGVVVGESAEAAAPAPAPPSEPGDTSSGSARTGVADGVRSTGGRVPLGPAPSAGEPTPLLVLPSGCASSIRDQSNPGTCLGAATTPALGKLYPLSSNLFVAVSGEVGIGTTSPTAKLHVAGTARMTDTLTLAPAGDQALAITSGSIYKDGTLFLHTHGTDNTSVGRDALSNVTGSFNTAVGKEALRNTAAGAGNTAVGHRALRANTTGFSNTAVGSWALKDNTTGSNNTASGNYALYYNTSGSYNTATGRAALSYNTTGNSNTAVGGLALLGNTSGSFNTATGRSALSSNTTGWSNTASGNEALLLNTVGSYNTASGVGALRDNTSGSYNTASGISALRSNTSGSGNTACGVEALFSNTTGTGNTASGGSALRYNTIGYSNTANGSGTLRANTAGIKNTATGFAALQANTTGDSNTACGFLALTGNSTGHRNIALGQQAGISLTGSDNIDIGNSGIAAESGTTRIGTAGTHTRAFIAGIRGVTTANANAIPVLIDSAGQLGTVSSSRRFKEDIDDMGERTERLLELRPVVFHYRQAQQLPDGSEVPLEYGLIAEEVAEVFPELVVFDEEGEPFTVKYHLLSSMLLNELQSLSEAHGSLAERDAARERELAELRERIAALEDRGHACAAAAAAR